MLTKYKRWAPLGILHQSYQYPARFEHTESLTCYAIQLISKHRSVDKNIHLGQLQMKSVHQTCVRYREGSKASEMAEPTFYLIFFGCDVQIDPFLCQKVHGHLDQLTSSKLLKEPSGESVASHEVDAAAKESDL